MGGLFNTSPFFLFFILVFSTTLLCHETKFDSPFQPKTWKVDLDKPPAERWPFAELVPVYNASMHEAIQIIKVFIPEWFTPVVKEMALRVLPHLGDYGKEISAGASYIGFELSDAVLLNILYEVEAGCTSLVAQMPDNTLIHGRNLDFPLTKVLRDLVIHVEFQKAGQTAFNCTTFAGYVGCLTGMSKNFGVSLDQRQQGDLVENLLEALMVKGTSVTALMIRSTLERAASFQDALDNIVNTPLAAPSYIILSGLLPGEGTVVTRDRNGPANLWSLDIPAGRWFLTETNYDHWKPAGDKRRAAANQKMSSIGRQNITLQGIFETLSTPPVLNDMTTYTTLMCVKCQTYTNYVRTFSSEK